MKEKEKREGESMLHQHEQSLLFIFYDMLYGILNEDGESSAATARCKFLFSDIMVIMKESNENKNNNINRFR